MVQSLTLRVSGELSDVIMAEISEKINPESLVAELERRRIPNQKYANDNCTTYDITKNYLCIPTQDRHSLKLKGNDFYGQSDSGETQSDKLLVRAIALRGIQGILRQHEISSRLDLGDVEDHNYVRLAVHGVLRSRRKHLKPSAIEAGKVEQKAREIYLAALEYEEYTTGLPPESACEEYTRIISTKPRFSMFRDLFMEYRMSFVFSWEQSEPDASSFDPDISDLN